MTEQVKTLTFGKEESRESCWHSSEQTSGKEWISEIAAVTDANDLRINTESSTLSGLQ